MDEDQKNPVVPTDDQDDENVKPLSAGDDFSDDTAGDDVNSSDAELDVGVGEDALGADMDEETIQSDSPTDNPLETESAIDEVDNKVFPDEQENLGDVVYNPLEDEDDEE